MPSPSQLCPQCQQRYSAEVVYCPDDGTALVPLVVLGDRLLGQVIGERYRIVARIGEGGMGTVYKAAHTMMDRFYAVKVLRSQLASNENAIKRFQREAQAASRLDHEHCVRITDFGRSNEGALFLVMEYVEGGNLKAALEQAGGRMAPARAMRIGQQIAAALAHAHAQGLIHRDLKPDNVLLTERPGRAELVKVADFGLAKLMAPVHEPGEETDSLTESGVIFGTPSYMAPEQAQGFVLDARTDLYSLGVILYQLLVGEVPFAADNPVTLLTKQVLEPPVPPRTRVPEAGISQELEQLVLSCLAKEAKDRPANATEVRLHLGELRTPSGGLSSITILDALGSSPGQLTQGARWRQRAWWAIVLGAGALAVALSVAALLRDPTRPGGGDAVAPRVAAGPPELAVATPVASPPEGGPSPNRAGSGGGSPRRPLLDEAKGALRRLGAVRDLVRGAAHGSATPARRPASVDRSPTRPGAPVDELLQTASDAMREGHYAAAREALDQASTLRPGDARVEEAYGDLLLEVGNAKEAARRFRKAASGACGAIAKGLRADPNDRLLRRRQAKLHCR